MTIIFIIRVNSTYRVFRKNCPISFDCFNCSFLFRWERICEGILQSWIYDFNAHKVTLLRFDSENFLNFFIRAIFSKHPVCMYVHSVIGTFLQVYVVEKFSFWFMKAFLCRDNIWEKEVICLPNRFPPPEETQISVNIKYCPCLCFQ